MSAVLENQEVRVRGTVQGVGFRPAVYRLAVECQLHGEVSNDTDGVLIRLSGMQTDIRQFLQRLQNEAPPLAKIDSINSAVIDAPWSYQNFRIAASSHGHGRTEIVADAATCRACLDEIANPAERRYLYPFTNCTHCGPRLSIIEGIPYDRETTTMAAFTLCPQCQREYADPLDRRFHAQPVACHDCGPRLSIHEAGQLVASDCHATHLSDLHHRTEQQLEQIHQALSAGKIVAVKGLGGFHLCCDASNHASVEFLRQRKQRYAKPFALMSHDMDTIKNYCSVSALEAQTLQSAAAPVVLLETRQLPHPALAPLSHAIAPGSHLLGFMLPYTPLHHMISQRFGKPLVMTSGNLSGEPQITDNTEAILGLGKIADLIVCHNRDIANRIDDSVVRCTAGKARVLRRARGYAPRSIALPAGFENADQILAYGAELKSTFCLVKQGTAILSQHQGDLEDVCTFDDYEHNLALYQRLFEFSPRYLALDHHPEYICNKLARSDIGTAPLPVIEVQHHHAHIASAMAENQITLSHPPVLGIALDGLGLGDDGTLWGGEFLLADYCNFKRVGRFKPVAMPGAAQAIKQPWRNSYAQIVNSMRWNDFIEKYGNTALAKFLAGQPITTLHAMMQDKLNCPVASSAGRLFDAVAGAIGLHAAQVQFEGQAAMELEMLVDKDLLENYLHGGDGDKGGHQAYRFSIESATDTQLLELNAASIWPQLLGDLQQDVANKRIATRFHAGLITGICDMVDQLQQKYGFHDIALSGGCMQNAVLLEGLSQSLSKRKLNCLSHAQVPANDGGVALGQAVIAAARIIKNQM
ncbi:carbamoyltransferase HypF [Undibacterium sp. TJN19]|uniref:carbamoyltransferase HypF n=1 Tax=Undibacterium sp. TJN19 TaxID=3413055 RepID=UPI003BF158F1